MFVERPKVQGRRTITTDHNKRRRRRPTPSPPYKGKDYKGEKTHPIPSLQREGLLNR